MKMNSKLRRILLTVCSAALLVCVTVGATVAYLTSTDTVTNTFTVGKVAITLDEAKVNNAGEPIDDDGNVVDVSAAKRVTANSYKLMPGHTYTKDPTVTVLKGSETSYVKMTVTFTMSSQLDAIFAPNGANMTSIFDGYDSTNWIYKGNTEDTTKNTRTYEFWYKETVTALESDVVLDALFDQIVVPGTITNAQIDTIKDMTITVKAYAIQADGFDTADKAWAAYAAN